MHNLWPNRDLIFASFSARIGRSKNFCTSEDGTSMAVSYMRPPAPEHTFEVGDVVEAFCDHERGKERVRGWIKGIVVQIDNKMIAIQFRSNVFLTDGWMVPDHILWFPLNSEHLRPVGSGRKGGKKDLPDF